MAGGLRRIVAFLLAAAGAAGVAWPGPPPPPPACGAVESYAGAAADASVDARAIRLRDGRVLRLAGIEPFNLFLPDADRAEAELQAGVDRLVGSGAVRIQLVSGDADRYGRLPAMVWAGDVLLQEAAAREGLAIAFANGVPLPCFDRILAAEDSARAAGLGFWKGHAVPAATPSALGSRIGRFAIFTGRVLSVGNRPGRSYLNFGRRWSEVATVEIAARDREAFGGEAKLAALAGRRVRVRGFLRQSGGPMLTLRSPIELEVLDAAKESPGNAP